MSTPEIVRAVWTGGRRFDAGRVGGPTVHLDGSGQHGPTPPDALLSALATCSAIDLVDILAKRRTPVESLSVDMTYTRRAEMPRRFETVAVTYALEGEGIERVHAERAIQLAFEKYCSVSASLAPDIVIETVLTLNGAQGAPVRQPISG